MSEREGERPFGDRSGASPFGVPLTSLLGLVLLAGASGCDWVGERTVVSSGPEATLWEDPGGAPDRTMIPVEWNLLWSHGSVDDTLLIRPLRMQGYEGGVLVLDGQTQRVLALDRDGRLRWTFGSAGEGPEEFRRARDLRLGGRGDRIYVHDPELGRITVVDTAGRLIRDVGTRNVGRSETLVSLGDSLFVFVTGSSTDPVVVLDAEGRVRSRTSLPWDGFEGLPRLSRQGIAATDGNRWAYGFLLGNGFFAFQGLDPLSYVGRYVEHTDFPTVTVHRSGARTTRMLAEPPICSGCSLTLNDGILYVLFGGGGPDHARIVDLYRWRDGDYLGSYAIPIPATWIHARGDRFYVLADVPYPEINALELPAPPEGVASAMGSLPDQRVRVPRSKSTGARAAP
ncbi:MAG: hypothetical protein ACOC8K_08640 [Gemmatimonadota bacterium]